MFPLFPPLIADYSKKIPYIVKSTYISESLLINQQAVHDLL
ncbi:Uncharacterized protein dnl_40340 [Desulfonema limicola]|uniref:Uncharacterized protein n=1 Tax=Desulfonema limicola TaxID=45656 RepID=A0A975B9Y7_9BACT|nr:Uncharacterized protein dnl_40340 [Desulfonema limicola]